MKAKHPQLTAPQIAEGLASHKPSKVERTLNLIEMTTVDKFTERTLREAKELIIEAGPENHEVIAWACRKTLVEDCANVRDGGKPFRSRFQVMRSSARKAIADGGIPSGNPKEEWYGPPDPPDAWKSGPPTNRMRFDLLALFPEHDGRPKLWPDGYIVHRTGEVFDEEGKRYHHFHWDGSTDDGQAPLRNPPDWMTAAHLDDLRAKFPEHASKPFPIPDGYTVDSAGVVKDARGYTISVLAW